MSDPEKHEPDPQESDPGLLDGFAHEEAGAEPAASDAEGRAAAARRHRGPRSGGRRRGCLPAAFVGLVLLALVGAAGYWGYGKLTDVLAGPADYAGPGHGHVVVQVHEGDTSADIGQTLKQHHVVKSTDAFIQAARKDTRSRGIQVGYYPLQQHMPAAAALRVLIDPANLIQSLVTVPEGARVRDIVKTVVDKTDISRHALEQALSRPGSIGLPAAAHGDPEGYLFPATYTVAPGESATKLLSQMVDKTAQVDDALGVSTGAQRLGLTKEQVITVASILEYEAKRDQDYPKMARAIYNRLDRGMPLQIDATVKYAEGSSGQVWTSDAQRASTSPYNTYQHKGLPPGPIGSPGKKTLHAALHPADGPWLYWVTVNLRTGQTKFASTLAEHNRNVEEFRKYCQTSDAC